MKIAIISDLHLHNWNKFAKKKDGRNTRLLDTVTALNQVNDYNKKNGIDLTICAGDIFHTFSYIENDVLNAANDILRGWHGTFLYIAGNHDLKAKKNVGKQDVGSAVFSDLGKQGKIIYLDEQTITVSDSEDSEVSIYGLGWRNNDDFKNSKFNKADIGVFHKFVENNSVRGGSAIPAELIDKYKLLIFGDVHTFEHKGKILIPGSLTQQTFNDEGVDKYFHIYDTETDKLESIEVIAPKFLTVSTVKDIKDKVNYYRLSTPVGKKDILPENAIAQEKLGKQDFRDSGLDISMSDSDMVEKYCDIKKVKNKKIRLEGLDILSKCESTAIVPQNYKIQSVQLQNFCSFQGLHTFTMNGGLWLVTGKNGEGKTSIFEALFWCIFGKTTKGMSADDIVNDVLLKDCMAKVTLVSEKDSITVHRYRGDTKHADDFWFEISENTDNEDTVIMRDSKSETLKELLALIGTDESFFKNVNYFCQKNFEFFSTLTDSKQKALCKNLLQLDKNEEAEDRAKKLHNKVARDFTEYEANIAIIEAQVVEKKRSKDDMSFASAEFERKRTELIAEFSKETETRKTQEKVKIKEREDLRVQQVKLQIQYDELTLAIAVNTDDFEATILRKQQELQEITETGNTAAVTVTEARDKLRIADNGYRDSIAQLEKVVALNDARIGTIRTNGQKIEGDIEAARKGTCTQCKQKLPEVEVLKTVQALADVLTEQNTEQAEIREKTVGARTMIMEIKDKFAEDLFDIKENIAVKEKSGQKVQQEILTARDSLTRTITEKEAFILAARKLHELDEKLLLEKLNSMNTEIGTLDNTLAELETAIRNNTVKVAKEFAEVNPYDEKIREAEKSLSTSMADLQDKKCEIDKCSDDMDIYSFWVTGFGNQGITSYLLDGFAKSFTDVINKVLLDISGGKYAAVLQTQKKLKTGEFREKFSFTVFIDGKKRAYEALSGGQQARVNLATVLTLNRLVKQYYGLSFHPFGLLILDELFTYLDAEGAESVLEDLKAFAVDNSVYVITHKLSVQAQFEKYVNVSLTDTGGSVITYDND